MTAVITSNQAKQITGGRMPLTPAEYEDAVKALEACTTFDESKYWKDKADALAAWAKIYHDKEVDTWARRLKLRAFRRLGELSIELRPLSTKRRGWRANGRNPGHVQLMMANGMKRSEAVVASAVAKVPDARFQRALDKPIPPAPSSFIRRHNSETSEKWRMVRESARNPFTCSMFCQSNDPAKFARALTPGESAMARKLAVELSEWLDKFEQALPKEAAKDAAA